MCLVHIIYNVHMSTDCIDHTYRCTSVTPPPNVWPALLQIVLQTCWLVCHGYYGSINKQQILLLVFVYKCIQNR